MIPAWMAIVLLVGVAVLAFASGWMSSRARNGTWERRAHDEGWGKGYDVARDQRKDWRP